jgi:hypothetical protein
MKKQTDFTALQETIKNLVSIKYGTKIYSLEQAKVQVKIFQEQGRIMAAQRLTEQINANENEQQL